MVTSNASESMRVLPPRATGESPLAAGRRAWTDRTSWDGQEPCCNGSFRRPHMTQVRMSLPVAIPRALTHYRRALAMEASGLVMTRAWFAPGLRLPPHEHGTASVAVVLRGGWDGEIRRAHV